MFIRPSYLFDVIFGITILLTDQSIGDHGFWQWMIDHERYSDVIMGMMASQITSLTVVYSIVYSGITDVTALCDGNSPLKGEFPLQGAGDGENVSRIGHIARHQICFHVQKLYHGQFITVFTLYSKCHHFDKFLSLPATKVAIFYKFFLISCTESCHFDKFQCNH